MSRPRVLLSGDEGTGTLAAVRALHAGGYEVWLAVSRSDTYAVRSRRCASVVNVTDPVLDTERHAQDLAKAAGRIEPAVLLPGTEGSLRAVTGRENLFPAATALGTCPPDVLDLATDKLRLTTLARESGLDAPDTVELLGVEPLGHDLPLPGIIKPRRTVTVQGRGLRTIEGLRVETIDELQRTMEEHGESYELLQRLQSGALGAVCGVAWRGEVVCAIHQRSPRIWPPGQGTSSWAVTVGEDPRRSAGVAALVRAIGWSGIFGVQFLLAAEHAWVIDFNPRIYGSLALATAAGANLPAIWADLLLGRLGRPATPRAGIHYRSGEDDLRALASEFRDGKPAQALLGLLPRPRTARAVFALSDPAPAFTSVEKALRRLGS